MQGIIKVFFPQPYYGFIIGEDGEDYFFHGSDLVPDEEKEQDTYTEGENVTFDAVETPRGKAARNVYHAEA